MTSSNIVLGIHDGHNCGATLVADGVVIASVSEERLTRRKNEVGYPTMSVAEVLRIGGVDANQLTEISFASLFMHATGYLTEVAPWYKVGIEEQRQSAAEPKDYQQSIFQQRKAERIDRVIKQLAIPAEKITFVEHHLAHLAAAYYTAPWDTNNAAVLGLTCDGAGDGLSATVSICKGNTIERISSTGRHASLGKIYSRVTFLMGMKPWEHEYKLMGMAPYSDAERNEDAAAAFRKLLRVSDDGLGFEQVGELSTNFCYKYLREALERIRFDTICGATQLFTEEMLIEWIRGCLKKTGLKKVVLGGGVFMNVKANMLIAEMPEIENVYVMPSGGDESLSIGAALHRHYQITRDTDHRSSRLGHLYLGGEFDKKAEEQAVSVARKKMQLNIVQSVNSNATIADLLAQGETVALCRGRMEWGARALGNRSIVTSADNYSRVDKINRAIKMRDFWMPFAPSIREEAADRYFYDPKGLLPWFMTFAFTARKENYADIVAGSHPRDHTLRPQVVRKVANPAYHGLISEFEDRTGMGAVLNTSFNLHGEPIVHSPSDALYVLENSGLNYLSLNNLLIEKT